MANDRWDHDDPYRPRRYGNDEEYERNFWQDRESRGQRRSSGDPRRRYESTPVLGMDMGGSTRGRGDWRRFDERADSDRNRGYARDTDWSNRWGARGLDWSNQRGERDDYSNQRGERSWWDRTQDEVRSWMGDTEAEHRREIDHRGRGPRGYTRSDERIREDVSDWLMEDRYVDASEIDVTVSNGEVTLAGMVDSREAKRRAEDIAASAMGVKDVHNSLRVRSSSSYGSRAGDTSGAGAMSGSSSTSSSSTSSTPASPSSVEPRH
jgi:osmotically-inducible protein OsmY